MFAYTKLMQAMSGAVAVVTDAYFNLVTLLLNTTATNGAQNNTFLDSSTNNFTITRNGNTTQGTFTPFSQTGWSNYLDGTAGQYLNTPSNAAFAFGTGDFTVEAWVFLTGTNYCEIFITTNTTPTSTSMRFIVRNDQKLEYSDQTNTATSTGTIPLNTWTNVAVSRSGTSVKLFINGTQDGSTTSSNNLTNQVGYIGRTWDGFIFTGYISNLRVTKGGALYTSNFTPSTVPLTTTVSSGTVSLLTCQSNRFLDNSTNAFTLTVNGAPSVQAFSPFLPTTAYDTSVVGGSAYGDGNGDYLSIASNAAFALPGDFTAEFWVYLNSYADNRQFGMIAATDGLGIWCSTSGYFQIDRAAVGIITTSSIKTNLYEWCHVAATRSGSTLSLYINGVQAASTTYSTAFAQGIMYLGYPGYDLDGYMSSTRLVKGQSLTTGAFTPPTTPVNTSSVGWTGANVAGSITGTISLLTNFTNAGIFDSAAKNVLETVGNAQASTTQAKWGTTSMAFDGTGDWLLVQNGLNIGFNTGNFTVEGWINLSNVTANETKAIVSGTGTDTFGLRVGQGYLGSVNGLNISKTGVADLEYCAFTFSINTWYHIAVVRSGTTIYFFVDGVQQTTQGSGGGSFSFGSPTKYYVGCNNDTNEPFVGYIDDLRITKGYARYTANFTPPTAPFPTQ